MSVVCVALAVWASPAAAATGASVAAADVALKQVGVRYKHSGAGPGGFDCSGLTSFAFAKVGISLPRSSFEQFKVGRRVRRAQLRKGDLVFAYGKGHVGIYVGRGKYVHATKPGDVVRVAALPRRLDGARRVA